MLEIAGGIILAVLFFVFLPQILALGAIALVLGVAAALLIIAILLFSEAPAVAGVLALVAVGAYVLYTKTTQYHRFAQYEIPRLLVEVFNTGSVARDLATQDSLTRKDVTLGRGFALHFQKTPNQPDGFVTVEAIKSQGYQVLCTHTARWSGNGWLVPKFEGKPGVDVYDIISLRVDLEEYLKSPRSRRSHQNRSVFAED